MLDIGTGYAKRVNTEISTTPTNMADKVESARGQSCENISQDNNRKDKTLIYLLRTNLLILFFTFLVLLLQGFHVYGFNLSPPVIYSLIAASVTNLAELFYIVVRFIFSEANAKKPSKKRENRQSK